VASPGLQYSKWKFYKILDYNTPNGSSTRSWITTLQMEVLQDPGLQHSKWNFYKILDYNTLNGISTRSWITTL
jgi:hypothetical protein